MKEGEILDIIPSAELGVLRESFPPPSVAGEEDNNGIIRFDMKCPLITPLDNPREVWFDHAIVQETSPTHAEATLKFLMEEPTNLQKTRGVLRYSALISVVSRLY